MQENTNSGNAPSHQPTPEEMSRRTFVSGLSIACAGLCSMIMAVPIVGFVVAPLFRKVPDKWIPVGKVDDFKIGTTVDVPIADPSPLPWAGITSKSAAWLRRESADEFIAFSVNCSHMGCPVRWLSDAQLFMCPCHGGIYYKDGTVAAGPPPKPLYRFAVRVVDGTVQIRSAPVPITTTL